jgi:gluconokinase
MIINLMGVSGSGKTTVGLQLAADLGWSYYDGDDFHSLKNIAKMSSGIPLSDEDRTIWLTQISQHIEKLIKTGENAIISCSALKLQYRRQLQIDPKLVKFVHLKGSKELIKKRLTSRAGHFMKVELLESQFESLEEPENALIVEVKHPPEEISANIQAHFGLTPQAN